MTPQNWLFLTSYKKLRERLLKQRTWNLVVRLGELARLRTIAGRVVLSLTMTVLSARPARHKIGDVYGRHRRLGSAWQTVDPGGVQKDGTAIVGGRSIALA